MKRRGRKRKDAIRTPDGRIRQNREDPRKQGIWNRILHEGTKRAIDPALSSEIGRLVFWRHITETQADAARLYQKELARIDELNGYNWSTKPHPYERVDRGRQGEQDDEMVQRTTKRFEAAHGILEAAGALPEAAVSKLCRALVNEHISEAYLPAVHIGLDALAGHYGLGKNQGTD